MTPVIDIRWRRVSSAGRRATAERLIVEALEERGILAPRLVRSCSRCGGPHGRVRVAAGDAADDVALAVSVSYAAEWAIIGVAGTSAAFAIDAEPRLLGRAALDRLRATLGDTRADAASWTRVESALKADGRGLLVDPADVRLSLDGDGWVARIPGRPESLRVEEWRNGPPGVIVSVATAMAGAAAASDRSTH